MIFRRLTPTDSFTQVVILGLLMATILLSSCSTILSASRDTPIGEHYGKRTPGAALDDKFIQTKARVNLKKIDARFKNAQVRINSYNGVVLLTGNVPEAKNTQCQAGTQ